MAFYFIPTSLWHVTVWSVTCHCLKKCDYNQSYERHECMWVGNTVPLISHIDTRCRWVVSFTSRSRYPQYPLHIRMCESQKRSRCFGEDRRLLLRRNSNYDSSYWWNKSNKMQQLRFLFAMALLYMFRVTISPIIRSTMMYTATGKLAHLGCY